MRAAKKIWAEVNILSRVQQCSNVARLHAVYEDDTNVYIVQEVCHGGDLDAVLAVGLLLSLRVAITPEPCMDAALWLVAAVSLTTCTCVLLTTLQRCLLQLISSRSARAVTCRSPDLSPLS